LSSKELDVALRAAKIASKILVAHFKTGVASTEKSIDNKSEGLVTVADLETEKAIIDTIKNEFPDHDFLAEESTATANGSEHLWVIDPLDGTNNFAFGIPHFGTSIAYYRGGVPMVGVVVDPLRDDWYVAERGKGAKKNGELATVCDHAKLQNTICGTGFYYDRGEMMSRTLRSIESLFHANVQGVRRMGAATLDLSWVGCGQFGAFFEYQLSPWDFAAAKLFVTEAGGKVTDCEGNEIGLESTSVLATNGLLHEEVLRLVQRK
jgi:myo-inositol-1(or 4)-monophosphatase